MASTPWIPLAVIGVGILLLATPAAAFTADFGGPTWEYAATEITVEDGDVVLPDPLEIPGPVYIEGIVCTDETRSCALERHVHEQGELTVPAEAFRRTPYEYVRIEGEILEATHEIENGTAVLSHEEVDPATAVRRSSGAYDFVHPAYRAAIEDGETTAEVPLETPRVITRNPETPDEQFFYVYETDAPNPGEYEPSPGQRALQWGIALIGFTLGLILVLFGQRMRIRRKEWYQQLS